jgi:hypothetical protein
VTLNNAPDELNPALAALEIRHPNPKTKHVLYKFIIFNPFHL